MPIVLLRVLIIGSLAAFLDLAGGRGAPRPPTKGPTPETRPCVRTGPSGTFSDSLGVNVHMGYLRTAYAQSGAVLARLRELGIDHVRDGIATPTPSAQFPALRTLARDGIRTTMILGYPGQDPKRLLSFAQGALGCAIEAVEGPNEYDKSRDLQWRKHLARYEQEVFATTRTSYLRNRPILGPSLSSHEAQVSLGDISTSVDFGSFHPYPAGLPPEDPNIGRLEAGARINSKAKPLQATETGYQNAIHETAGPPAVPAAVAGVYVARLALENYRRGIERTFFYELIDEGRDPAMRVPQDHFGLLDSNLEPKPAFISLRNLLRTIGPQAIRADAHNSLALGIGINSRYPDLHQLLLVSPNRSSVMAVWRSTALWDTATRRLLPTSTEKISITLPRSHRHVTIYRPSRSAAGITLAASTRVLSLALGADPLLIKFSPSE